MRPTVEALTRMLDHYVHTARAADRLLFSHGETILVEAPTDGVVVSALESEDEALAWFETERASPAGVAPPG